MKYLRKTVAGETRLLRLQRALKLKDGDTRTHVYEVRCTKRPKIRLKGEWMTYDQILQDEDAPRTTKTLVTRLMSKLLATEKQAQ